MRGRCVIFSGALLAAIDMAACSPMILFDESGLGGTGGASIAGDQGGSGPSSGGASSSYGSSSSSGINTSSSSGINTSSSSTGDWSVSSSGSGGAPPFCGDGQVEPGEQCDDGNANTTDACVDCLLAFCGDGFFQFGLEECDDGNDSSTDSCVAGCTIAKCGDGFVHAGFEECDDGNSCNNDACVAGCKLAGPSGGGAGSGSDGCGGPSGGAGGAGGGTSSSGGGMGNGAGGASSSGGGTSGGGASNGSGGDGGSSGGTGGGASSSSGGTGPDGGFILRDIALARMKAATTFFSTQVARRGGYAWHQRRLDLSERWGDIKLDADQIMIQSPGTSDVAVAYVEAAEADPSFPSYVTYATAAAQALTKGQIQSGGWRLYADFKPAPTLKGCYLIPPADCGCAGCTSSTYDDQATQNALIAIMRVDRLLGFANASIFASSAYARPRVQQSQYPTNGGFPQVFSAPIAARPSLKASYPPSTGTACGLEMCFANSYPGAKYYDDPTLNDNLASALVEMLVWAKTIYPAEAVTYQVMLDNYGTFLLQAQMPQPQPAWAQQYDINMKPRWARSWEAPAIAGQESQDVMWALLRLYQLKPAVAQYRDAVGVALTYLEPLDFANDSKIKRYIELDDTSPSNKGFQTVNPGGYPAQFSLAPPTYQNYGWEPPSYLPQIRAEYERLATDTTLMKRSCAVLRADTQAVIDAMVDGDKWVTNYPNGPRSGSTPGEYLDTQVFAGHVRTLAEFIKRTLSDCAAENY